MIATFSMASHNESLQASWLLFIISSSVSFSVDSPGGDDDVVLGAGLLEDSPVDSSDTADSICCSGIIGFGELNKPRHNRQIGDNTGTRVLVILKMSFV